MCAEEGLPCRGPERNPKGLCCCIGRAHAGAEHVPRQVGLEVNLLRAKVKVFVELHQKTLQVQQQAQRLLEIERRELERRVTEERQAWEMERLREEKEKQQQLTHELTQKADQLARTSAELTTLNQ